jgi:hypothetical protein
MLVIQSGSENKSHRHDFLGDFCSYHLSETVETTRYEFYISCLCTLLERQNNLRSVMLNNSLWDLLKLLH